MAPTAQTPLHLIVHHYSTPESPLSPLPTERTRSLQLRVGRARDLRPVFVYVLASLLHAPSTTSCRARVPQQSSERSPGPSAYYRCSKHPNPLPVILCRTPGLLANLFYIRQESAAGGSSARAKGPRAGIPGRKGGHEMVTVSVNIREGGVSRQ